MENNALSSTDEKQRQDAKWSLPYLDGHKKAQAEKLVADLDAKDKAFDVRWMLPAKDCLLLPAKVCVRNWPRWEKATMNRWTVSTSVQWRVFTR